LEVRERLEGVTGSHNEIYNNGTIRFSSIEESGLLDVTTSQGKNPPTPGESLT